MNKITAAAVAAAAVAVVEPDVMLLETTRRGSSIISSRLLRQKKYLLLFVFIFYFSILGYFIIDKYSIRSLIIGDQIYSTTTSKEIIVTAATATTTKLPPANKVDNVSHHHHNDTNNLSALLQKQQSSDDNTASTAASLPLLSSAITDINNSSSLVTSSTIKQQQIENYRQGKGLMLNMHPVHHAGTTFCGIIGRNGINGDESPNFACVHDKEKKIPGYDDENNKFLLGIKPPWTYDEMNLYIDKVRQYFHMISWEFNSIDDIDTILRPLKGTNWEHPKLISIVITRDPISRLLAGNAMTKRKYIGFNKGIMLHERWWDYIARDYNKNTDNFFLRMIGNYPRNTTTITTTTTTTTTYTKQQQQQQHHQEIQNKHIRYNNENNNNNSSNNNNRIRNRNRNRNRNRKRRQLSNKDRIGKLKKNDILILEKEMALKKQNETFVSKSVTDMLQLYPSYLTKKDYEDAVQMLNRFTIVLDIACLNDGMIELSKLLGLNTTHIISTLTTTATTNTAKKGTDNKGKHLTSRQRIGYDDVYEYLIEKNYWDIKLYEYSKNISLVRC